MMFADLSSVSANTLKDVVVIAIALATPLISLLMVRRMRVENQPLEVVKADKFITRDFHTTCHASMESRVTRVETEIIALRHTQREMEHRIIAAGEERAVKLHARINDVLGSVSELKGRMNQDHRR